MIRKIIYGVVALTTMFAFVACDKDDNDEEPEVVPEELQGYWFKYSDAKNLPYTIEESNGDLVWYGLKFDKNGEIQQVYYVPKNQKLGTYNDVDFTITEISGKKFQGKAFDGNTYSGTYDILNFYCESVVGTKTYIHPLMDLNSKAFESIYLRDYTHLSNMKVAGRYVKLYNLDLTEASTETSSSSLTPSGSVQNTKLVGSWANDVEILSFKADGTGDYTTNGKTVALTWSCTDKFITYTAGNIVVNDQAYELVENGLFIGEVYYVKYNK